MKCDIEGKMACKDSERDKDETTGKSRLLRNEGEKLRRDRLNNSINELGKLLPVVSRADRKVDKSTILRQAANYLRFYRDFIESKGLFAAEPNLQHLQRLSSILLESRRGFLFVLGSDGTLVFATDLLTSQLGHSLLDVVGLSFYNLVHPEDLDIIPKIIDRYSQDSNNVSLCSCYVRISSTLTFHQNHFECVHIQGFLKRVPKLRPAFSTSKKKESDEIYLVAVGRVVSMDTIREISMLPEEMSTDVWVTQTSLDGHILHLSQSYALISGRLASEAVDVSSYDVLHKDDIPVCARQHVKALQSGATDVLGTYLRFYDKDREIIYSYCTTHMVTNPWTQKLKYLVTVHHVISEEEGKNQIEQQISRISREMSELTVEGSSHSNDSDDFEVQCTDDISEMTDVGGAIVTELHEETVYNSVLSDVKSTAGDNVCKSEVHGDPSYSVQSTEGEINFIPELIQMAQFDRPTEASKEQELVQSIEKFKKASEQYKKQAGIAITHKKRTIDIKNETDGSKLSNIDVDTNVEGSTKVSKRKMDFQENSEVKTPLLHNLLVRGSIDDSLFKGKVSVSPHAETEKTKFKEHESGNDKNGSNKESIGIKLDTKMDTEQLSVEDNEHASEDPTPNEMVQNAAGNDKKMLSKGDISSEVASNQERHLEGYSMDNESDSVSGTESVNSTDSSATAKDMKPESSQGDVSLTIQLHLASQLQGKYEMLQEKLTSQQKEISDLKAKTELFLSLNPQTSSESRRNALLLLESKRKQHEHLLVKLKQDYAAQMSVLTSARRTNYDSGFESVESPMKTASNSSVPSPASVLSSLSSGTSSRSSSVSPSSLNQPTSPPLPSSVHQRFTSPCPDVTMGLTAPYPEICYAVTPQASGFTATSTAHQPDDLLHPVGYTTENSAFQVNIPQDVTKGIVTSSVPLNVTTASNGQMKNYEGLRMTPEVAGRSLNNDRFCSEMNWQHQDFNISQYSPGNYSYSDIMPTSIHREEAWAFDKPYANNQSALSEGTKRVTCKNPNECPTGGHCSDMPSDR